MFGIGEGVVVEVVIGVVVVIVLPKQVDKYFCTGYRAQLVWIEMSQPQNWKQKKLVYLQTFNMIIHSNIYQQRPNNHTISRRKQLHRCL